MKKFLENLISTKEQRVSELKTKVENSNDVNEVRNITSEVETLTSEIAEARAQLAKINDTPDEPIEDVTERGAVPSDAKVVGSFNQSNGKEQKGDVLDSMEYREAFANYVRTGKWVYSGVIPEKRDEVDKMLTTDDTSVIIPNTIMKEFIKEIKEYGSLFNEIRKTNVKGGVEYPIEDFKPEVKWITETETSKTQDKPKVNRKVSFNYHICEAKVGQSLLDAVVTLDTFEKNIADSLTEAFLAEFDRIILNGDGDGKPTGILVDDRILDNHKISMSEADIKDWKQWRRKLMSKVSLGHRAKGVFAMTANTWENYIMTMCDDNNRPLAKEAANVVNGNLECTFMGRKVYLVEDDVLPSFDDAQSSEAFAVYFNPKDYCINTNLRLALKKYFNDDTNKWTHKGLMIVDGKILDVNGCFIIKKSTETSDDGGNG
ncbi:MAG: phage major capsid protein [Lachnospiraceae bacterium]|nr:phage major capsid protein [Lachnospiraceae bacterium]